MKIPALKDFCGCDLYYGVTIVCTVDFFACIYDINEANGLRLISPLYNIVGLSFMSAFGIGVFLVLLSFYGACKRIVCLVELYFFWNIIAFVTSLSLSVLEIVLTGSQCLSMMETELSTTKSSLETRRVFLRSCVYYAHTLAAITFIISVASRIFFVWVVYSYWYRLDVEPPVGKPYYYQAPFGDAHEYTSSARYIKVTDNKAFQHLPTTAAMETTTSPEHYLYSDIYTDQDPFPAPSPPQHSDDDIEGGLYSPHFRIYKTPE